jgi:predicted nuclease of predicted toxin-antitoxin system
VLARAQAEDRVLLTFDKDFGELAFKSGLPATCGVVLFRLSGTNPHEDNARALEALAERQDWGGHFAVVQSDRIRMRSLPGAQPGGG